MLSLVKVNFKGVEKEKYLSLLTFSSNSRDYSVALSHDKLKSLDSIINKLQHTSEDFYIAFHQDMNNVPFVIIDQTIYNFSEDSIYNFNDIERSPAFKTTLYTLLFMIIVSVFTIPLTLLLTQIPGLQNLFWPIFAGWDIALGGYGYYCIKRYLGHYSFVKNKLVSRINFARKYSLAYLECDF